MSGRTTIVVSDVHLGEIPPDGERAFLEFLASLPGRTEDLLINGDLFDFWFEYRSVVLRRYFPALRRLAEIVEGGVRIRLVGGNHDGWGGDFLRDEIGVELLDGPLRTDLGGRRAYVAHGDGLLDDERAYRAFRAATRSGAFRLLFRLAPPDLALPLVRRVSSTPGRVKGEDVGDGQRADRLAAYGRELIARDPEIELVVFGHAHRPELIEVEPGRHYLNAGDWVHHRSYALVTPESVLLKHWNRD